MNRKICLIVALFVLMFVQAKPAAAQQRLIVRTTSLPLLQHACLLDLCQIVGNIDGTVDQLFLVTFPNGLPLNVLTSVLRLVPGVQDVEVDLLRQIPVGPPFSGNIPNGMNERTLVNYYGTSVWMGYAQQPASAIIQLNAGRTTFNVSGRGIVADIDTGVDFTHPALQGVLLQGYDFTRNQAGGNEMADAPGSAGLDQSSAGLCSTSPQRPFSISPRLQCLTSPPPPRSITLSTRISDTGRWSSASFTSSPLTRCSCP